ncbi:MAG TPA: hypothetical protein VIU86_01560 [Gaiellaceae bacterium]
MRRAFRSVALLGSAVALLLVGGVIFNGTVSAFSLAKPKSVDAANARAASSLVAQGKQIFRYDTFGDQAFWSGTLQLDKAIEGAKNGGVGGGVSPKTALALGLKVDANALPKPVVAAIKAGKVNLNDPATTITLLKLNAVVGVKGFFDKKGNLTSVGLTCAVCHSTVDNSFAPGIGSRLDGWPNRDLNVGAIVAATPNHKPLTDLLGVNEATLQKVLASWGPGKFDAEVFLDGKAFRPDGKSAATLIPPAFGLAGVNLHTFEGWGSVTYWNAFVANLEMHGIGNFTDTRLDNAAKFPIAAKNRFGHVRNSQDLISSKLPALHVYQLTLKAPTPPKGSFDPAAAARGKAVFMGQGKCATCHMPPTYSEPGYNLHTPASICTDAFQADRSPDGMYRTTPLKGLFAHAKGGFYHDGRYPDLLSVVAHYNSCMDLGLSAGQQSDLVQFLKSI